MHAWAEQQAVFDTNGQPLDPEEAGEYAALFWDDGVIADAFRYSNEHHNTIDPQKSLYDFFVDKSSSIFLDEPVDVKERKRRTFLRYASFWSCYIGSPVTRQSLKFFWLEETIEGENPFVAETYHKILYAVAEPARKLADIRLNHEIVDIQSDQMADTNNAEESSTPKLRTVDGSTHSFDEVVVTTPLGWLKQNKSAFQPSLPTRLTQAIDNIGYGHLDKVYITFPKAFWNLSRGNGVPNGLDSHGTTPNTAATAIPLHQPPSNEHTDQPPSFVQWLEPHYAHSTNPEQWMQTCLNLSALQPNIAHPTLLFYIQGPQSKYIADLVSSAKSDEERDTKLLEFFRPYYSRLPNYNASDPSSTPKAVLATAWANDKFAGNGSYSNFQIGLEKGDEDIETMRHGMPDRGIWLAGEHTAPFIALGTSTGAYMSGQSVAERIAKAYVLELKVD